MDFDKAITYNGLSLNTVTHTAGGGAMSGYAMESFQPVPPDSVGYLEKRALQDGMDASDVYLGGRVFRSIVTAYGTSKGDFWDKAQDLLSAFTATIAYSSDSANKGFLALDFYQPTADISTWPTSAYPSGIPMRYYVRPIASPEYVVQRDRDGGIATRGFSKPFSMSLVARDPRKYLQSSVSVSLSTATQTATYRGDYPTFPVIAFSMSAAGSSAFTLRVNEYAVVIDLSAQSSGTFSFDYGARTFIGVGSGDSKWSLVTSVAGLPSISSGSTFRYSNATGISSATITYREAWA